MNLPNQLTVARLLMSGLFVVLMSVSHVAAYIAAFAVFVAASITDYYDGKIARARNQITNFGKLLDPVADKVLTASAFVMLMTLPSLSIPGWTVVAILAREFLVTGARSLAASDGEVIGANRWGKTKTAIQITYVLTFLFFVIVEMILRTWFPDGVPYYSAAIAPVSTWAIVLVALYTVYSGIRFAQVNWRLLRLGGAQ